GQRADVVVLLGFAEVQRVRRLLHPRQQRREQLLLREDQILPAVPRQLVLVAHGQRTGRARLDAQPAEDAPSVVDLVHLRVPLARRVAILLAVVRALDVDRVRGARPGAQLAPDALLQPVGVAVEDVPPVVARGDRLGPVRVRRRDDLAEHVREGHAETLDRVEDLAHVTPPCSRWCRRPGLRCRPGRRPAAPPAAWPAGSPAPAGRAGAPGSCPAGAAPTARPRWAPAPPSGWATAWSRARRPP